MTERRLAAALGALSLAADATNGFPAGKVLRTTVLVGALARDAGVTGDALRLAWWTPTLRYLGCTAYSPEEGARYGAGDDVSVRTAMGLADLGDPVGTLVRVWRHVARGAPLPQRLAAIGRLLGDGRAVGEHAAACVEGATALARIAGFAPAEVAHLAALEARWDGTGVPQGLAGADLPLAVRLHHVIDAAELMHGEAGVDAALALVRRRAGGQLDPDLAARFVAKGRGWLAELGAADVWERFLDDEPAPRVMADEDRLDAVCLAFAHFADQKSTWTLGHSPAVARLADKTAAILGLPADQRRDLRRAALLHDLGRVSIPNRLWDKPGPLTWAEREQVREHALRTERILAATPPLRPLAAIAAAAHERLDGAGYHRSLPSAAIDVAARVLAAADVATALGEARPHRPAKDLKAIITTLSDEVAGGRLDAEVVRAVTMALGADVPVVANPNGLSDREVEVLALLARGRTNKEIAATLGLSPKTVQHHVAHVYDKVGVTSRAAAALFAVEHALLWRAPS